MERPPQNQEKELSAEKLAENLSMFMTKPENTDMNAPLLLFLKANNLRAKTFRITLDRPMIDRLYPGIQHIPALVRATDDHLLGKEVEVFLVTRDADNTSSESVLNQVVKLVGEKTDPVANEDGTLRKQFHGETRAYKDADGKSIPYFENGFHRPRTSEELVEQLNALGLLEEAQSLVGK